MGYSKAVDWYALGILIYELLVGKTPFDLDDRPITVYNKILSQRILFPRVFNEEAKSLIKRLTKKDLT